MPSTRREALKTLALAAAAPLLPRRAFALPDNEFPNDPQRPAYHLQPIRGWMNDPCAPVYWHGQYHMFHQYNPHAAVWGDMHWAHATSPDMVRWTRQPIALAPTPGGADSEGCFTGSSILHNGAPAIIYTGVQTVPRAEATLSDGHNDFRETQNLAIATDNSLNTWTKHPTPVIPAPPPGMKVTGFRDPTPFHLGSTQYLLVGSGQPGVGGCVLLYRAAKLGLGVNDLTHWEYLHPLLQGKWSGTPGSNPVDTGEMWECPDFFPLGGPSGDGGQANDHGKFVLIYSTQGKTLWHTGALDPATLLFHPEKSGELDYGRGTFYAPKTQLDAHGNRILWGWIPETRPEADYDRAGWSGMMSLPRRLYLINGQLHMEPAAETATLRAKPAPGPARSPATLPNTTAEFSCVLQLFAKPLPKPGQTSHAILAAGHPLPYTLTDPAGPLVEIRADYNQDPLTIRISGPDGAPDTIIPMPEPLPAQSGFHLFLDRSVIEIFVDSRYCITRRFYSRDPAKPAVTLTIAGSCLIGRAQSFSINSIWTA